MHVIILCLLICLFSASGDRKLSYSKHSNKILKFRGGSAATVGEDAVDALPSATVTKGIKRKNNSKGKKQIVNSKGTWLDYIRSFFHSSNRKEGEDGIVEKLFKFIKESLIIFVKKNKPTRKMMTKEHLEKSFTSGDANSRIQKEMRSFIANPPDNCELFVGSNIRSWVIGITGAEGTIYAGEKYKLKMIFPKDYPSKPPSVYFLKPAPKHMHVYSNGDICLVSLKVFSVIIKSLQLYVLLHLI